MSEELLIELKNQCMQDGKLNLSKFADLVADWERQHCATRAAIALSASSKVLRDKVLKSIRTTKPDLQ